MASRVPTAPRTPVLPQKRTKLSRRAFAQLMLDQKGRCADCGHRLCADGIIDEHLVPLDQGGTNDLDNRALYCTDCARAKTSRDVVASARGRRVRGETGQRQRQARRRAGLIKKPSFATNRDGRWKKRITGEVVKRSAKPKSKRRRSAMRAAVFYASPGSTARLGLGVGMGTGTGPGTGTGSR